MLSCKAGNASALLDISYASGFQAALAVNLDLLCVSYDTQVSQQTMQPQVSLGSH